MAYLSDLTNEEWALIEPYFGVGNFGNRRKHSMRTIVNALLYIEKTGAHWRDLPNDFPSWKTVYTSFTRAVKRGVWEKVIEALVEKNISKLGIKADHNTGVVDSQNLKTSSANKKRIGSVKKKKGHE